MHNDLVFTTTTTTTTTITTTTTTTTTSSSFPSKGWTEPTPLREMGELRYSSILKPGSGWK